MPENSKMKDFLDLTQWSRSELESLLDLAAELKRNPAKFSRTLAGKSLAMIFKKSSTRTRVSFEVGMFQLGGQAIFMSSTHTQVGRGEPLEDTARVLSRYVDGIMIRTYEHSEVEILARYATVPVINGLTDFLHPCQVLTDIFTIRERLGDSFPELKVAYIGDGNNMANSWINAALQFGFDLRIAAPAGYEPDAILLELAARCAETGAEIHLSTDPAEVVQGADVVYTDVWASMGQEEEQAIREQAFADFQVDAALMKLAADDALFMHCLPAHRGEEVSAGVIDGPQSVVWDQAENRLHAQKAILAFFLDQVLRLE